TRAAGIDERERRRRRDCAGLLTPPSDRRRRRASFADRRDCAHEEWRGANACARRARALSAFRPRERRGAGAVVPAHAIARRAARDRRCAASRRLSRNRAARARARTARASAQITERRRLDRRADSSSRILIAMARSVDELSIDEIRQRYLDKNELVSPRVLSRLQRDSRQGVRQLHAALKK